MRKLLCFVLVLIPSIVAMGTTQAGDAVSGHPAQTITDVGGDADDPRGDLTSVQAIHGPAVITVSARAVAASDLAGPEWASDDTALAWRLDTTGDGDADIAAVFRVSSGETSGVVVRIADQQQLCAAVPLHGYAAYGLQIRTSCVGNPSEVRFGATLLFDRFPSAAGGVSQDLAPNGGVPLAGPVTAQPSGGYPAVFNASVAMWSFRTAWSTGPADAGRFRYGNPGQRPLLCDWDGNGTRTVGVFSNGFWYVRDANSAGPPTRRFGFGARGDVPVCGDWDGDGIDTVGVFRGGFWYLRDANSAGPSTRRFGFGTAVYQPVVGDWNTDGIDTIGLFRGGRWYLRNLNSSGGVHVRFTYGSHLDRAMVWK
jgi:hypothetical protein